MDVVIFLARVLQVVGSAQKQVGAAIDQPLEGLCSGIFPQDYH